MATISYLWSISDSMCAAFWGGGGGGLIRETKLPVQELKLKMQRGLMREGGGVIVGFHGIPIQDCILSLFSAPGLVQSLTASSVKLCH